DAWTHVFVTYDGSSKASGVHVYLNGQQAKLDVKEDRLTESIRSGQPLRVGKRSASASLKGELADVRFYTRVLGAEEVQALALEPVRGILQKPAEARTQVASDFLAQVYRDKFAPGFQAAKEKVVKRRQEKAEYEKRIPSVMVMEELKTPRPT